MTIDGASGGPDAHGELDESLAPTLARAVAVVAAVGGALAHEVDALDAEARANQAPENRALNDRAPAIAVQRLMRRSMPDVAGALAPHLGSLATDDVVVVLDELFTTAPFADRRMRTWSQRLRAHLSAYATSLTRWSEWNARTHDFAELDGAELAVRWATTWERPSDSAVAADFVGYVNDPVDLARPGREFATFLRDAESLLNWLGGEHHGHFKGLRLWIVGSDSRPVVRWLRPG